MRWCDNWRQQWTEIQFYGLKCGLFGIALHLTGRAGMHVIVANSTEQDCVVLDWVAISCSGRDWTGRDWAELSRIALLNTALDWTRLYCYWLIWTWATLDLNVLGWEGMNWNWTGTISIGLDGTGLDRASVGWTGLEWAGERFRWLNWTALYFTGLDCLSLSLTSADCNILHQPGLNWKVPYRTAPGTAFHVSKWNW